MSYSVSPVKPFQSGLILASKPGTYPCGAPDLTYKNWTKVERLFMDKWSSFYGVYVGEEETFYNMDTRTMVNLQTRPSTGADLIPMVETPSRLCARSNSLG
jgi:hypothetical protein